MDLSTRKALIAMNAGSYEWPEIGTWRNLIDDVQSALQLPLDDRGTVRALLWMDDDLLVFSHNYQGADRLASYNCTTKTFTVLHPGYYDPVRKWYAGFNRTVAGGGVVAGFSNHAYWDSTVFTERHGQNRPPLAVDNLTGTVCVQGDYNGFGLGIFKGNDYVQLHNGSGGYVATFEDGILDFWNQGTQYRWAVDSNNPPRIVQHLPTMSYGGNYSRGWNRGYSSLYNEVIWEDNSPERGYQMFVDEAEAWHLFKPTIRRVDSKVYSVTAIGEGELAGESRRKVLDLDDLANTPWRKVNLTVAPPAPPPVVVVTPKVVVVPQLENTTKKIGIGIFDEPGGPDFLDPVAGLKPTNKAVFHTWDTQQGVEQLADVKAWGELHKLVVGVYCDFSPFGTLIASLVDNYFGGDRSKYRLFVQCYPREFETIEQFRTRTNDDVGELAKLGYPINLVAAAYCQYRGDGKDGTAGTSDDFALDEQKVVYGLEHSWWMTLTYSQIDAIWCFVYDRVKRPGVDGIVRWPNIKTIVNRMRFASGDWQTFPMLTPVVVVEPSPVPPPIEPPPPVVVPPVGTSPSKPSSKLEKVMTVVPLLIGFGGWLWKKLKKRG